MIVERLFSLILLFSVSHSLIRILPNHLFIIKLVLRFETGSGYFKLVLLQPPDPQCWDSVHRFFLGNKQLSFLVIKPSPPQHKGINSSRLAFLSLTSSCQFGFFPEYFLRLKDTPSSSCVFQAQPWNQIFLSSSFWRSGSQWATVSAALNGAGKVQSKGFQCICISVLATF